MSLELAELSDSRWKANTHKEACECLRVVFKKRRLQSPAVTNCRSVILKIVNRQADNMAKVNNHRLRVDFRVFRRSDHVESLHLPLSNCLPVLCLLKVRILSCKLFKRMNWAQRSKLNFLVLQVATLRDNDQSRSQYRNFLRVV